MAVDAENYIAEIFYYFQDRKQTTSFVGNYSAVVDADYYYSAEKFAEKMAEQEVGAVNNADS